MNDLFQAYEQFAKSQSASTSKSSGKEDSLFAEYPSVEAPTRSDEKQSEVLQLPKSAGQSENDTLTLENLLTQLNELTGLQNVKEEIRKLIQYVRVQEMRRTKGFTSSPVNMHSIFYGSPGTGKTTIARLYGQMLKSLGLLSKGHLVETDRSGLVGNYVGQTANKTDEKIREALGGVLFIDEAYSLHKGDDVQWDYGSEAIQILLKRMEDYREDFVVIAAGYVEPMNKFLHSNEGFKSRFSTFIYFDDYSPTEMEAIFLQMCQKENYVLADDTLHHIRTQITSDYSARDESFGNARYIRNLFQAITRNQALRVGETIQHPKDADLLTLMPIDVTYVSSGSPEKRSRTIGF